MQLDTKFFGTMEYTDKEVIHLYNGLFGFEKEENFVLIHFDDNNHDLLCLQSIKTPSLAFILMNPFSFKADYHPEPAASEWIDLDVSEELDLNYYVICVIGETPEQSTVNLKCPIIINPSNNQGRQIILDQPNYKLKHSLALFSKKEG